MLDPSDGLTRGEMRDIHVCIEIPRSQDELPCMCLSYPLVGDGYVF